VKSFGKTGLFYLILIFFVWFLCVFSFVGYLYLVDVCNSIVINKLDYEILLEGV